MGDEVAPVPPKPKFACGEFIGGVTIGIVCGLAGNIGAMALSGALFGRMDRHHPMIGMLIGVIPGIVLILIALRLQRATIKYGILVTSIFILLSGGLCGGGVAGLFG